MTKTFEIAHIKEKGQDIIILPRDGLFMSQKSPDDQEQIRLAFQLAAMEAGLKGVVCLVWQVGQIFSFVAPLAWHPYFRSIGMDFVVANLNRTLTISYEER